MLCFWKWFAIVLLGRVFCSKIVLWYDPCVARNKKLWVVHRPALLRHCHTVGFARTETLWTAVFQWEFKMAYIAQNKKITTGRFHFGVKFSLFKGRDRPQWKVIEWRRRRNIIVDEMCPAYSDRADIGSLKVQPQFSITTFPEELILSVLLGVSNFFPI